LSIFARYSGYKQDLLYEKFHIKDDKHKYTKVKLADSIDKMEYSSCSLQLYNQKYQHLVEESEEIVFSLDENLKCIFVNKSVEKHLGIKVQDVIGKSFLDLLYDSKKSILSNTDSTYKQIKTFLNDKKTVSFFVKFISPIKSEPKEMFVKMIFLEVAGRKEIIVRVSNSVENTFLNFLVYESKKIKMDNSLIHAEEVSKSLTKNLSKFLSKDLIVPIKVIVREMLLNAIEHGNLNITYEEKSKALIQNNYFELIQKRLADFKYSHKKVYIDYEITSENITYQITDEGDGFDHKFFMKRFENSVENSIEQHGRGIAMALNIFEKVEYNSKGNSVFLQKKIDNIK